MFEDGKDMEFRTPSIEPEESDNPSVTFHDSHGRIMEKIFNMFPEKFQVDDNKWLTEAHKLFGFKSSTPPSHYRSGIISWVLSGHAGVA